MPLRGLYATIVARMFATPPHRMPVPGRPSHVRMIIRTLRVLVFGLGLAATSAGAQSLPEWAAREMPVTAQIRERFARIQREMTPNNLRQAQRPERAEVLPNLNGTAPGLWIEQDGRILVMLPGPPHELVGADPIAGQQHHLRPPDVLLRAVAVGDDRCQSRTIRRRDKKPKVPSHRETIAQAAH